MRRVPPEIGSQWAARMLDHRHPASSASPKEEAMGDLPLFPHDLPRRQPQVTVVVVVAMAAAAAAAAEEDRLQYR